MKKRPLLKSDTTIQRYTEPELEPCINYANYCLQSSRETSVIIFSGGRAHIPKNISYKAPSTRMRIFLKTEVFFSVLALRSHVNGVFGMRKRRFSKTLSRVEVFENAVFVFTCRRVKTEGFENVVFVFTCGRVKTEVFENDDVIIGSSL